MNELNNDLNQNQEEIINEISENNSQNYNQVNDEELINAYIGKNAEKIRKGKFSLWTCLFGTAYVFYRKMWLLGFVWYLINIFISLIAAFITLKAFNIVELLQSSTYSITTIIVFVSSCVLNIIVSFLFKKLYIKKSEKKVETIKQKNSNKTNEELKKICAKKGGTTVIGIVAAILLSGVVETISEPIIEKITSNEMNNKFAESAAYSIISSVESAYTDAFLETDKDILTIEDVKKEYNSSIYTWNDDNTIKSKSYKVVCNVIVNSNNELIVECDVKGKKIKSEPLSMKLNNSSNDKEEQNTISYNIVAETVSGGLPVKKLYVNKKLVTFQGSDIEVTQLSDILIVEVSFASSTLYAVDKEANIIGVFVPENNDYYENIQKIVTKAIYRNTYRIDGNDLYVTTDRLAQDPNYAVCNRITNDDDVVIYEEKFTYLGSNKFSNAEVVNTITRKQYMQEHNISCSSNNDEDSSNLEQNENISIFPIKTGKTIKFYKIVDGYFHVDDYKNEKEISKYTCTSEECGYCSSYTVCSSISILGNNLIALYDYNDGEKVHSNSGSYNPSKIIVLDVKKGKEVARYNDIISAYNLSSSHVTTNSNVKYIVLENKNNKTAIVDLNGNYIKKYLDKKYVISSYEGRWIDDASYLVENDMIVTIKDNKYGIESIEKDKVLINHNYDEIVLYDSFVVRTNNAMSYDIPELYAGKYFKARIGDKWSLYDIKTGNKVIDKDYDRIYLLDKNTIAVYNDGYLSFVDYKGNSVSDDKIKVSNFFETMPKNPEGIRFTIGDSSVKISISERTDIDDYKSYSYEYSLKTKKLTKLS